jgi:predicted transcriptional regulator
MSKQAKLLSHLQSGAELTARQITGSFGLKNPREAVRQLRLKGYCVYSNQAKLSDGREVVKYRIGTPTKRMVAVANAILGSSIFTRTA